MIKFYLFFLLIKCSTFLLNLFVTDNTFFLPHNQLTNRETCVATYDCNSSLLLQASFFSTKTPGSCCHRRKALLYSLFCGAGTIGCSFFARSSCCVFHQKGGWCSQGTTPMAPSSPFPSSAFAVSFGLPGAFCIVVSNFCRLASSRQSSSYLKERQKTLAVTNKFGG